MILETKRYTSYLAAVVDISINLVKGHEVDRRILESQMGFQGRDRRWRQLGTITEKIRK